MPNAPFSVRFVRNTAAFNHFSQIKKQCLGAINIKIATAYLSKNGVEMLLSCLPKNTKIQIFTSLERTGSELEGLYLLWKKSCENPNFRVFLVENGGAKPENEAAFFHSKFYYFEYDEKTVLMVGSANMTLGGWVENDELSVVFEQNIADRMDTQAIDYFENLSQKSCFIDIKKLNQYAELLDKEQAVFNIFEIPPAQKTFLYHAFFQKTDTKNLQKNAPKFRILKQNLENWLRNENFENDFLNLDANTDSNGFSSSNGNLNTVPNWLLPRHRPIVRFIAHHQALEAATLWRALHQENLRQNTNLTPSQISEILEIYQPRYFTRISEELLFVLRLHCGVRFHSEKERISPETYAAICAILQDLKRSFGLKNLNAVASILLENIP